MTQRWLRLLKASMKEGDEIDDDKFRRRFTTSAPTTPIPSTSNSTSSSTQPDSDTHDEAGSSSSSSSAVIKKPSITSPFASLAKTPIVLTKKKEPGAQYWSEFLTENGMGTPSFHGFSFSENLSSHSPSSNWPYPSSSHGFASPVAKKKLSKKALVARRLGASSSGGGSSSCLVNEDDKEEEEEQEQKQEQEQQEEEKSDVKKSQDEELRSNNQNDKANTKKNFQDKFRTDRKTLLSEWKKTKQSLLPNSNNSSTLRWSQNIPSSPSTSSLKRQFLRPHLSLTNSASISPSSTIPKQPLTAATLRSRNRSSSAASAAAAKERKEELERSRHGIGGGPIKSRARCRAGNTATSSSSTTRSSSPAVPPRIPTREVRNGGRSQAARSTTVVAPGRRRRTLSASSLSRVKSTVTSSPSRVKQQVRRSSDVGVKDKNGKSRVRAGGISTTSSLLSSPTESTSCTSSIDSGDDEEEGTVPASSPSEQKKEEEEEDVDAEEEGSHVSSGNFGTTTSTPMFGGFLSFFGGNKKSDVEDNVFKLVSDDFGDDDNKEELVPVIDVEVVEKPEDTVPSSSSSSQVEEKDSNVKAEARSEVKNKTSPHKPRTRQNSSSGMTRALQKELSSVKQNLKLSAYELQRALKEINTLQTANSKLKSTLQTTRECLSEQKTSREALQCELEGELDFVRAERDESAEELERVTTENWEMKEEVRDLEGQLEKKDGEIWTEREKVRVLEEEVEVRRVREVEVRVVREELDKVRGDCDRKVEELEERYGKEVEDLKFQLEVLKNRLGDAHDDAPISRDNVSDPAVAKALIQHQSGTISSLETRLLQAEVQRRSMHNRIQELRGNIRVYVRVRPFLSGELQNDTSSLTPSITVLPNNEILTISSRTDDDATSSSPDDTSSSLSFSFDHIFPPAASQTEIFSDLSDFVQSALDGYDVSVFAYGQTGSGKTHTMQGCAGDLRGVIPRAVEQILNQAKDKLEGKGGDGKWGDFSVRARYLEIYNETLRDLLLDANTHNDNTAPKLLIRTTNQGKVYVENLSSVPIDCSDTSIGMKQLNTVMETAARSRSVSSTRMNAQSSRSHSVFILEISGKNLDSGDTIKGSLNLCDLAGSERLSRSASTTDSGTSAVDIKKHLKETQAINKSLSCLGDVFHALASGSNHVPYRNSKLTHLLKDCFMGDGKALMFVNLSPTMQSRGESICSLRFAQRVNKIELGKATRNVETANPAKKR